MSIPFKSNQEKLTVLQKVGFGERVAEDEVELLASYFVETESWRQIFDGKVDIVYGAKGVGKSALYSLLTKRDGELFSRNILLAPAENPRGTPVFADLVTDPPRSEREFQGLWKLYFVSIIYSVLTDYAISGSRFTEVRDALVAEGLVRGSASLRALLTAIVNYAKKVFRPSGIEGGVEIDPVSGLPNFHGRISFSEVGTTSSDQNTKSVDELLSILNGVLREKDIKVWILLDRLDVAFAEHPNLEANALKGLFRVYLDLLGFESIKLKIFLRSDIWKRITEQGFREASHITRTLTIEWERKSLLNLVVRRLLFNRNLVDRCKVNPEEVLRSSEAQERFFYDIFPQQVEIGANKPETFDWILGRTRDAIGNAPREIIHLLNSVRRVELKQMEISIQETELSYLFSRLAFKNALNEVSLARLEQTLFAEYPTYKPLLQALQGAKTRHTIPTLMNLWNESKEATEKHANQLAEVGFFKKEGTPNEPEFWIPFLYRDGLDLVQGTAD